MGPVDLIISESSYAGWIRGEKGGAEIEASMPRPIRTPRSAPLRARPQNFASREIREQQISLSDAVFPAIRRSEIVEARKITRRKNRMDQVD